MDNPELAERTSYDPSKHRQSLRKQRERGCWVYIAAEELQAAGIDLSQPPPAYRVWGRARGGVLVRLYGSRRPK